MSKANFTKGPWMADIRCGCCAVYPESRETDTAGCHYDDDRNIYYSSHEAKYNGHHWVMSDEVIANAHLIAAAPDMYGALDMLMDTSGPGDAAQLLAEERENIMEILAKARGETA